ncbi:MAG: DinB family protein, partial [Gammaproteobacteria bacterium]|nr:DinB family protein [Gammaproteobacteria bacterium]
MTLNEILREDAQSVYRTTAALMRLVDGDMLDWKPSTGSNWMTTGQLLKHLTEACGAVVRSFVTGDWGIAEGTDVSEMPGEEMLPSAEAMGSVSSVEEALKLLAEDEATAIEMFAEVSSERLVNERSTAPWGGPELSLWDCQIFCVNGPRTHTGTRP